MGAGWVRSCNDSTVLDGESVPRSVRRNVCSSALISLVCFTKGRIETQSLTLGTRIGSRSLDRRAVPALDGVQHTLLLFALGSKTCDPLASDDRFARLLVDDTGEDGSSVAAISRWSVMREDSGRLIIETYTADTIPPSA